VGAAVQARFACLLACLLAWSFVLTTIPKQCFFFIPSQFCYVAKVTIIHKPILAKFGYQ
jgi:hypothetical protein